MKQLDGSTTISIAGLGSWSLSLAVAFLIFAAAICWDCDIAFSAPPYPTPSYYVSTSGSDSNPGTIGSPFKTVQKAANSAQAGELVEVQAGTYVETLRTMRSGTISSPIVFKASGTVNLSGARILHSFIVLDGFTLDGNHADVSGYQGVITVGRDAVGCLITGNRIHDWKANVYGIHFDAGSGRDPDDIIITENTLINAGFHMVDIIGSRHRIERNTFNTSNGWDALRVFGDNHVIRANYLVSINENPGIGNHVDIIQGFDDIGSQAHDVLFEPNFIYDSKTQIGQINNDRYSTLVYNWTFRGNVFAKMFTAYNLNASVQGVNLTNNTMVGTGIAGLGEISDNSVVVSNAFVGNGGGNATSGYYRAPRGRLYPAMFRRWIDPYVDCTGLTANACLDLQNSRCNEMLLQMQGSGFLGAPNGNKEYPVLASIGPLSNASQLNLPSPFSSFQEIIFQSAKIVYHAAQVFRANNNFVAGPSPGFAVKDSNCPTPYNPFNFCEAGGINGGDPQFQDISNPLGPDNLPFTADDGLRPAAGSRLCSGGENGGHIGAYPCSGPIEPVGAGTGFVPPPPPAPSAPAGLTVLGS